MQLCIFNPEHDLCLAKGRAHYVPPRSAVEFARRDASRMSVLYPEAECCSVYDLSCNQALMATEVVTWGWNAVVRHELQKRGVDVALLPMDEEIDTIRELQHRSTVLPLQEDCHEVRSIEYMESLLKSCEHWVLKAPWSGAGRGLRWVHGSLTPIDRDWIVKTVANQRCVIAEPRRDVVADLALEYMSGCFMGYSYFKTGSGVYKENVMWTDARIVETFHETALLQTKAHIEEWLAANVWPRYRGPLGVDLMVDARGQTFVSEINFRHTMGMVAHEKINQQ